jgi:plasmid stabilization system protein ParE
LSLPVDYHALARADLYAAWEWYEERQTGLGDRFAAAVDAAVVRAARWPATGLPVRRDDRSDIIDRKLATPAFPYVVRYRVVDGTLLVMAVSHQRRRPSFGDERAP